MADPQIIVAILVNGEGFGTVEICIGENLETVTHTSRIDVSDPDIAQTVLKMCRDALKDIVLSIRPDNEKKNTIESNVH